MQDILEIDTPENILARHPEDRRFIDSPLPPSPTPGRGVIGQSATFNGNTACAVIYIGCGRHVIIDGEGNLIGDDEDPSITLTNRVSGGAWLPETLYWEANRRSKE